MKDAKGHGSDSRGGPAHQAGVRAAVPGNIKNRYARLAWHEGTARGEHILKNVPPEQHTAALERATNTAARGFNVHGKNYGQHFVKAMYRTVGR